MVISNRNLVSLAIALSMGLISVAANSASLYKWIDANGNVTYQDTPPPDNVEFEETNISEPVPPSTDGSQLLMEEAALANPVSLYTVPACDSCDLVRLFLERNSVPFAEKNVRNNVPVQDELETKSGSLEVPTLIVGDKVIEGYSRSSIKAVLVEAGFPIDLPENAQQTGDSSGAAGELDQDGLEQDESVFEDSDDPSIFESEFTDSEES